MKKELGGNRLGSGGKMDVDMKTYNRSNHDLSYVWRNTQAPGTLVPFMCKVALPGDTWDIDLQSDIKTHPTVGPLFGSFKAQYDVFECPIRLYNKMLINDTLNVGLDVSKIKFPLMRLQTGATTPLTDNDQINPSSLLAYLGIRGIGKAPGAPSIYRQFNALSVIMYWDIVKNYYANKQEDMAYVIHTPVNVIQPVTGVQIYDGTDLFNITESPATIPVTGYNFRGILVYPTGIVPTEAQLDQIVWIDIDGVEYVWQQLWEAVQINNNRADFSLPINNVLINSYRYIKINPSDQLEPQLTAFPLDNIDTMRERILEANKNYAMDLDAQNLEPYSYLTYINPQTLKTFVTNTQEGLAVKTYQSDINNNWMQTTWIDAINNNTRVDTSNGSFTIDQLLISRKIFDLANRIAMSGGSWEDYLDAAYTSGVMRRATSPIYCGGLSKELVFQEVVSNSETADMPLGTLAGRGVMSGKHKGGKIKIKVEEPSYIIGIVSLTPRLDYSQGNEFDVDLKTMADLHVPGMDAIGFQDRITDRMAWWDTEIDLGDNLPVYKSAGKQPAWIEYMTATNKAYGNFAIASNEMFMTLNRRYEMNEYNSLRPIKDLTTYIDPAKYNFIFAQTSRDAMNMWVQIAVNAKVRRVMSAKVIPNL